MGLNTFAMFDLVGRAMTVQRTRMDVVSSNLANAQTTRTAEGGPYRRRDVQLRPVPVDTFAQSLESAFDDEGTEAIQSVELAGIREDPAEPRRVYDPHHPDADPEGYVAYPNINTVEEMVNMITIMRSYQATMSAYTGARDMAFAALRMGQA